MPKLDATSEHTPPPLHKIFLCFLVRWERSVHILYANEVDRWNIQYRTAQSRSVVVFPFPHRFFILFLKGVGER